MSKWTLIVDVIPVSKFIKIVCARVKIFFGSKVIRRALNIIDLFIFIIFSHCGYITTTNCIQSSSQTYFFSYFIYLIF